MRVFVLLFNPGTENEGIHTLKLGDRNIVLAFEDKDDATRYALLLEAQDFMAPAVEEILQAEVEEFCDGAGYHCQLVPKGFVPESEAERFLLSPPETNLDQTDWQREQASQANEAGAEEVEDTEPAPSSPELDAIRRQLEKLL